MTEREQLSSKPIEELEWYEHMRLRPGMYVGRVDISGFIEMLKGVINAGVLGANTNSFMIHFKEGKELSLKFNVLEGKILNNWGQFNRNITSSFLLELFALNALSEKFVIRFLDESEELIHQQIFEKGVLLEGNNLEEISCSMVMIDCLLDEDIWGADFGWHYIYLTHQLREFAYLFPQTKFELNYKVHGDDCKVIYHFKNGLKDRIDIELFEGLGGSLFNTVINKKFDDFEIEGAFAFRNYSVDAPYLRSYTNNYHTHENGTHVDGLLKGLTYGVMKYFQKYKLTEEYKISEKGMQENLVAAINIKLQNPFYSGCVKNKLANPDIIEPIANHVAELLFEMIEQDEKATEQLIRKFRVY